MTDIFVFGKVAGERAAELAREAPGTTPSPALEARAREEASRLERILSATPDHPIRPSAMRAEIESVMSALVGFGRDRPGLEEASPPVGRDARGATAPPRLELAITDHGLRPGGDP